MQNNSESNWCPLQSNPQVINPYIQKLGLKTQLFNFQQMLSIQDWALQMIPNPVLGIMMLYQMTPAQIQFKNNQADQLNQSNVPQNLFFMKQYAENACGTIALFHIILNSLKKYPNIIKQNSYLQQFFKNVKIQTPQTKGRKFQKTNSIKQQHKKATQKGQTNFSQDCDSHFIAFVQFQGNLWQLDGMKKCPVNLGPCNQNQLLTKGSQKIQQYMNRDPQNINFSMIVLAKNSQ